MRMPDRHITPVNWEEAWAVLSRNSELAPSGEEPEVVWFDHPDDEWKNGTELVAIEEEHQLEVDQLIKECFEAKEWPEVHSDIGWCIQKRFDFVFERVKEWASVPRPLVTGIWSDHKLPVRDFFVALLTEYYWRETYSAEKE